MTAGGAYCAGSLGGSIVDKQVVKSCPSMAVVSWGVKIGMVDS
jgi:hypothetical protein